MNQMPNALKEQNNRKAQINEDEKNLNILYKQYDVLKQQILKPYDDLKPSPILVFKTGEPFLDKCTITQIQGSYGSHKSRLSANGIVAALGGNDSVLQKPYQGSIRVLYMDSERSVKAEFATAVKAIVDTIGTDDDFLYTSLLTIPRHDRIEAIKTFIEKERNDHPDDHIIVVFDVSTDLTGSFNSESDALDLFGFFSLMINDFDMSIIHVIHENPNRGEYSKARGHVGTEGTNKSSNVLSIKYEGNREEKVIAIEFVKVRNTDPKHKIYVKYNEETKLLVLRDQRLAEAEITAKKVGKETINAALDCFYDKDNSFNEHLLIDKMDAVKAIMKEIGLKETAARSKIDLIIDKEIQISHPSQEFITYKIGRKPNPDDRKKTNIFLYK
jgi:hypothetical protein